MANSQEFKIAMSKVNFENLVRSALPEVTRDKKGGVRQKAKKLSGCWVAEFQKLLNEYEAIEFKLKGK